MFPLLQTSNRVVRRFRDDNNDDFSAASTMLDRTDRQIAVEAHFMRVSICEDNDVQNPQRLKL